MREFDLAPELTPDCHNTPPTVSIPVGPMERYALHFLARRAAVVSVRAAVVSVSTEWLILKAAISMTTWLLGCACLLPLP